MVTTPITYIYSQMFPGELGTDFDFFLGRELSYQRKVFPNKFWPAYNKLAKWIGEVVASSSL